MRRCRRCGECCLRAWTVLVAPSEGLPPSLTEPHCRDKDCAWLRMRKRKDGSCVAFDRRARRCKIYANRPKGCREFQPGPARPDGKGCSQAYLVG